MKNILKVLLAILVLSFIQSVIISHVEDDIRETILSSFQNKPKKELFKVYHFLYEKKYDLNSEEGLNRYRIFKNNLIFIESQNTKNLGYRLGITDLTDLTAEEFRKSKLTTINPEQVDSKIHKFLKSKSDNEENFEIHYQEEDDSSDNEEEGIRQTNKIDWTAKMNPVYDQGGCGSCWAFATVHAIEGNYNIQFGNSPAFSTQQLVDCDKISYGCNGGFPSRALQYIVNKGLAFSTSYPYTSGNTGESDTCKDDAVTQNQVVTSYEVCPYKRCARSEQRKLLSKGPLIVYIDGDGDTSASSIFQHYKSGVLDMPCDKINHAVVLTGYNTDEKGEFLIGMNSWGSRWGEKGHFRFRTRDSDNTCFMEISGLLPVVKQTSNPVPPPPVPGCLKIYSECGFKGNVKEICGNTSAINDFPVMAGYDVGKFETVKVFFRSQQCRGAYFLFKNRSFSCFSKSRLNRLVNNIKSIIVDEQIPPAGCVWVYDDGCLAGNRLEICSDISDLNDPKYNFGNKISSIKIGPGVSRLVVYLGKSFSGNAAVIRGDRYGLHGTWLNKDIESIKISKA